jgi:hypothetical protein
MPSTYDPNCEATNEETVIAAHWECLRRNSEFCSLSERWLKSNDFRRTHALSPKGESSLSASKLKDTASSFNLPGDK